MNPSRTTSGGDNRLIAAMEEYRALLEAGEKPDREAFLARHGEIAEPLAECLLGLEFLHVAGPRLSEPVALSLGSEQLSEGVPLGDFRLLREVGRGGMGVVYEAEQLSLGRRVALKVLPLAATMDAKHLQRFQNEARAAACLHHPHVVPVYGVGCERGVHYYAMQLIEGESLADVITRHKPSEPRPSGSGAGTVPIASAATEPATRDAAYYRRVAEWGIQAAEALEYAHARGIVHRDVKPGNLLVDVQGKLWVADFGLARGIADTGLTVSGDLLGTLRYTSPEQALAKHGLVDHRTDVYALGATLYELLTLQPAVPGQDRQEILNNLTQEETIPPRHLNQAVPADLETVVLKAMRKEPADRYDSARELADDLRRFLEHRSIVARRPTLAQRARKWARRNRPLVASAVAALMVATLALAVATALTWQANQKMEQALVKKTEALDRAERRTGFAVKAANEMYAQVAEGWLAEAPGMQLTQRRFLLEALTLFEELAREEGEGESASRDLALALYGVGRIQFQLGRPDEAERAFRRAADLFEGLAVKAEDRRGMANSLNGLAACLMQRNRPTEAEEAWRRAVEVLDQLVKDAPTAELRALLARCQTNRVTALERVGRLPEAEQALRQALGQLLGLTVDSPEDASLWERAAQARLNLGLVCRKAGRGKEAEEHYRAGLECSRKAEVAAGGTITVNGERVKAQLLVNLGVLLITAGPGQAPEAELVTRQATELLERSVALYPDLPANRVLLAQALGNLAKMLNDGKRPAEAEPVYEKAVAAWEGLRARFPSNHHAMLSIADAYDNLGRLRVAGGRVRQAERDYRNGLDLLRTARGPFTDEAARTQSRRQLARGCHNFASFLKEDRQPVEAEAAYREAIEVFASLVRDFPAAAEYRQDLARCHNALGALVVEGRPKAAAAQWRKALEYDPNNLDARQNLKRLQSLHPEL